ncbi:hypothetical protein WICPIJ_006725 [Wickerhamomyces pijperi]|uniref:GRIP domain-containing protein n=1 Tax=Wickerhamomyces pijperi TaxID=599730 RepID=A0A9P8TKR3_WICPI|nr:hypothetical protein WICPIJ_006725 [Wickerhamomyces pijperi]
MAKKGNNKKKGNNTANAANANNTASVSKDETTVNQESKEAVEEPVESTQEKESDAAAEPEVEDSKSKEDLKETAKPFESLPEDITKISCLEAEISQLKATIAQFESTKPDHTDTQPAADVEASKLQTQLQEMTEERDKFSSQYEALLGRISSMKTIFTKMKESQVELEQVKEELTTAKAEKSQLESQLETAKGLISDDKETIDLLRNESSALNMECDRLTADLSQLRHSHSSELDTLQQQISSSRTESNDLIRQVEKLKESNEELHIIIANDKTIMKDLNDQISDLTDSLKDNKSQIDKLESEKDGLHAELLKLTKSKAQIEDSFKLKHLQTLDQITALNSQRETLTTQIDQLQTKLAESQTTIIKLSQLEPQLHEKTLLLNKSRHESVILNEHLTKALQLIKKTSSVDTVDKELISNLFISFVSLPRGDSKKFEVLQLIAGFLGWGKDQRVQVGLSHGTGESSGTGSGPEESGSDQGTRKSIQGRMGSFVSLWTEFLESESSSKS